MPAKGKKKTTKKYQDDLKDSVHKIWLAGLGALATAEEEGTKLFNTLVKKGEGYDKEVRNGFDKAARVAKKEAGKVRNTAGKAWEKIGAGFDDQVGAALGRMGVPTKKEIDSLSRKVDRLTKTLQDLKGKKKTTRRKTATRKSA